MKMLRKFIVRTCAMYYRIGTVEKGGTVPRISINVTILFFLDVAINIAANSPGHINWYDWIFIFTFVALMWIGFSWFGIGYFALWPVKFEELDDFQKYTFSRVNFHDLTEENAEEVGKIIDKHDEWFGQ